MDIDEVIVPLKHMDWESFIREVERNNTKHDITSISIRNVFKFPLKQSNTSYPEYMYLLRNQRRSETISKPGDYGKSFVRSIFSPKINLSKNPSDISYSFILLWTQGISWLIC